MGSSSIFGANSASQLLQNGLVTQDGQDIFSGRRARNLIRNRSGMRNTTGWLVSGAATVTRTTTSAEIIDHIASLKFAAGAANDYVYNIFTIPNYMKGLPVTVSFDYLTQSGAAGDWDIQIYDVTAAATIPMASSSQGGSGGNLPIGTGTFNSFFIASTNTSYQLRVVRKGGSGTFSAAIFDVSKGTPTLGFAGTDWQSYTPTITGFGTVGSPSIWYKRIGDTMHIAGKFVSGVSTAATALISLPTGLITASTLPLTLAGKWIRNSASAVNVKQGAILSEPAATSIYLTLDDYTTASSPYSATLGTSIAVTGDVLSFFVQVPISTWTSNTTMADRALEEYASNLSIIDADNTGSFASGSAGSALPTTLTGRRRKRVQFTSVIQITDSITLEVAPTQAGPWTPLGTGVALPTLDIASNDGNLNGASLERVSGSTTQITVTFNRYASIGSTDWLTTAGFWRVRKVSGGAAVGYPIDSINVNGQYFSFESIASNVTLSVLPPLKLVSSAAARTLTLPGPTISRNGDAIRVKDDTGNATTNNITITADAGSTIDGAATNVISTNYTSRVYIRTSTTTWRVI